jgi:hypothetical protein
MIMVFRYLPGASKTKKNFTLMVDYFTLHSNSPEGISRENEAP